MKKHFISFGLFIILLLSAGCKQKSQEEQTVIRQNIVVDHDKHHGFYGEEPGFGVLYYRDLEDSIMRVTFYDEYDYDYVELGDTLVLKMTKEMFRKEYNRCNMMNQDEMIIDPDSVLYKKNQILKDDPLVQARREKLRRKLMRNPIQIQASKAERIRR